MLVEWMEKDWHQLHIQLCNRPWHFHSLWEGLMIYYQLKFFYGINFKHPFIWPKLRCNLRGKEVFQQGFLAQPTLPLQGHAGRSLVAWLPKGLRLGKCHSVRSVPPKSLDTKGYQPRAVRSELTSCWNGPNCSSHLFGGLACSWVCRAFRFETVATVWSWAGIETWPDAKYCSLKTQQLTLLLPGARYWTAAGSPRVPLLLSGSSSLEWCKSGRQNRRHTLYPAQISPFPCCCIPPISVLLHKGCSHPTDSSTQ